MRTALELDLFNHLGESTTASELAQKSRADENLIGVFLSSGTGLDCGLVL